MVIFTNQERLKDNLILRKSFEFSIQIINYTNQLEHLRKYVFARQILKSGTSIGANIREAQNAESKADFIHKFKIALKEADETEYWLLLCSHCEEFPPVDQLLNSLNELMRIGSRIVVSAKRKN
jgi:four helix bundle protein